MIFPIIATAFIAVSPLSFKADSLPTGRGKCKVLSASSLSCKRVDSLGDTLILETNLRGDTLYFGGSRNKKLEGLFVEHFNNGMLKHLGHYKNGHAVDTSSEWDEQGHVLSKKICSHDGRSCQWTAYYGTGKIANTSKSRNFFSCDTSLSWFPDGKLSERVIYGSRGDSDRIQ